MNSDKVAELRTLLAPQTMADWVSNLWDKYSNQRKERIERWQEIDAYIRATDTDGTTNKSLPWTHNTTVPKLTQIRDNLHANYISSLFPNDKWLTWTAHSAEDARVEKAKVMEAYMENKTREGGFRPVVSRLLYDYIDKGNAFAMPTFEARYKVTDDERVADFIGPKAIRIDPNDIVFNPTAVSFENSFKVVRSIKTLGELKKLSETHPDMAFWKEAIESRYPKMHAVSQFARDDWSKATNYQIDGFGDLQEYYQGDSVEILEFYGDFHDSGTGELRTNRMITVIDRSHVARDVPIPSYGGRPLIRHVGWRLLPDSLWAASPLENLVGMQYMLDHYMNMGANALDLKVMSPKKIIGDVNEFVWEPNGEIHLDENGDVQEMAQQFGDVATVAEWMNMIEQRMEMYAGAPREAMGIRTPGEKTAHEVQALENAAGRIFQEKIIQFEIFMEQVLNDMLETAHANMDYVDLIRVVDPDLGVQRFKEITKEDITANGILRPIGARHFAQKAQELQNLIGIANVPLLAEVLRPHMSGKALTRFVEDVVDVRAYRIFKNNAAVDEAQETDALMGQAAEDNAMMAQMSPEMVGLDEEEAVPAPPAGPAQGG